MLITTSTAIGFAQNKPGDLQAVPRVEIERYLGTWYEIAKYPNRFQKQCVGSTTATYSLKSNGKIEVLNECLKQDGSKMSAKGEAKIYDKSTNAKLKVRFAPGFLSFFPFVWANYWIIDLDPDYKYVVIGEPKREYFWILSRDPVISEDVYQDLLARAKNMGYDPARVELSPQK
jgi:apolipoprotein D and lipocalin family protein